MGRIEDFNRKFKTYANNDYGIEVSDKSSVEGVELPFPTLMLGNYSAMTPDKGSYQLRDPIFKPAQFKNWIMIYTEYASQDAENFVKTLQKCAEAYAITINKPTKIVFKGKKPGDYEDLIKKNVNKQTQLVVAVYTPKEKHYYSTLKNVCCS